MSSRYANVSTIYLTSKDFWDWREVVGPPSQIDLAEMLNSTVFRVYSDATFLLPGNFSRNLILQFLGLGGNWEIVPTAGRRIFLGDTATSQGGRVKATAPTNTIELFSLNSGDWKVSGCTGNLNFL